MRNKLYIVLATVFCLLPLSAFAQDITPNELVKIGEIGAKLEGYMPCEVADPACDASKLQKVSISSFSIQKYEVTLGQVKACFDAGTCKNEKLKTYMDSVLTNKAYSLNAPLMMQREYAESYCANNGMRLPKPEEWLYAAMGGDIQSYPWGNEKTAGEYAAHPYTYGSYPAEIGSFAKDYSASGVYDMAGNVSEWVAGERMGVFEEGAKCGNPYTWPAMGNIDAVKIYERFGIGDDVQGDPVGVRCAKDN